MNTQEKKYAKELNKLLNTRPARGVVFENQYHRTANSLECFNNAQIDLAVEFLKSSEIEKADSLMAKCRKLFFCFKLLSL